MKSTRKRIRLRNQSRKSTAKISSKAAKLTLIAMLLGSVVIEAANATEIDLATMTANDGFVIHGTSTAAYAGQAVKSVGYGGTILIGAPGSEQVHVVKDTASLSFPFDLNNLNGSNGYTIAGVNVGYSENEQPFADLGDLNWDGSTEVALGGNNGLNIIYSVDASVTPAQQHIDQLAANGRALRIDVNNDYGPFTSLDYYLDYNISSYHLILSNRNGKANSGKSYFIGLDGLSPSPTPADPATIFGGGFSNYGSVSSLGTIIDTFSNSIAMVGGKYPYFGRFDGIWVICDTELGNVTGIGDIDGDNWPDFAVGARSPLPGHPIGYVVYGRSLYAGLDFPPFINLSAMTPDLGFAIRVHDNIDSFGYVADGSEQGHDVDGDGINDLVIGSYGRGPANTQVFGKVYVVFGQSTRANFGSAVNVTTTDGISAATITAAEPGDGTGISVSMAPDLNGDGRSDIVIGARTAHVNTPGSAPRYYAGSVYGVYGKPRPW